MAQLLAKMQDTYNYIFYDLADPRTKDFFPSPLALVSILSLYLYFTKSLGPRLMRDLKPFKLRTTIFYYNIFQIVICVYMLILAYKGGWFHHENFFCQLIDHSDSPQTRYILSATWWYTAVKLIDLLDTVFFVLRKKDRQISFLHVFHHTLMPAASFIGMRYFPTGHVTFVGVLNTIVHVFMYTYYLIAGLGPKYQKYLWWKRYITIMQLTQFAMIFMHNIIVLFSSCPYPKWVPVLLCLHSAQFVYLFGSFYYTNYIKIPKEDGKMKESSKNLKAA